MFCGLYSTTTFIFLFFAGLQKVGIRDIQIQAKFKSLGAKLEGPYYYWLSEPEIMEPKLIFNVARARFSGKFSSQIKMGVLL